MTHGDSSQSDRPRIISPLAPRADAAEVVRGVDLSGKTAVVTGGASGLGIETARALLLAGARVILPVRDRAKGERVAAELSQSTRGTVELVDLDLGSLASVRRGAAEIRQLAPQVHVLINNAGVMATPQGRTVDGFDTQKDAATYLGRALHDNGYASKADAQKIARALRTKAGPIEMSGITATITCQESAERPRSSEPVPALRRPSCAKTSGRSPRASRSCCGSPAGTC